MLTSELMPNSMGTIGAQMSEPGDELRESHEGRAFEVYCPGCQAYYLSAVAEGLCVKCGAEVKRVHTYSKYDAEKIRGTK